jgi:hypothetical protein
MGTKKFITIYIQNSFIVNIPTAAPLVISYLVSFPVNVLHIFYFFRVFLHLFLVIFFLVVCQEQRFCSILTGIFL